jgi:hypothetical protein
MRFTGYAKIGKISRGPYFFMISPIIKKAEDKLRKSERFLFINLGKAKEKGNTFRVTLNFLIPRKLATGSGCWTGRTSFVKLNCTIKLKTKTGKINFNGFCFFHKLLVNNIFKAIDVKGNVRISWLIQSHGKGWATSSSCI